MQARPYKLYNSLEKNLLSTALDSATNAWLKQFPFYHHWSVSTEVIQHFDELNSSEGGDWFDVYDHTGSVASIYISQKMKSKLLNGLLSEAGREVKSTQSITQDSNSCLEAMLVEATLLTLLEKSLVSLNCTITELEQSKLLDHYSIREVIQPGNAAVIIRVKSGNDHFLIILRSTYIQNFLDENLSLTSAEKGLAIEYELVDLNEVIKPNTLTLEVSLGSLDLSIGKLATLAEGDVIRLDKKITEPVDIQIGRKKILEGTLGLKDGDKAVRLN